MDKTRILAMSAAVVALVSCEVDGGHIEKVSSEDVKRYTNVLFYNSVVLPMEMAQFAMELDDYLALSVEEQQQDYRFFGKLTSITDDIFYFSDDGLSCTVDTKGVSVYDDVAEWEFIDFNTTAEMIGYFDKMYFDVNDKVTLRFENSTVGDAHRMVSARLGGGSSLMSLVSCEDGLYSWQIGVSGTDYGSDGLMAEYSSGIGTGGITVEQRRDEDDKAIQYICSGEFWVDIYNGSDRLFFSRMTMRPGYTFSYHVTK